MDKYEFNIKVEQIKKLVNKGDFETAMKIADTIDWRRVRSTSLLTMISQIYEKNAEYQDAKDILLLAYERAPLGKGLLYKLTDLALRENNIQEAEAYYREFCELSGDDPRQYLLRFLILEAKDAPLEQQINSLERYCQEMAVPPGRALSSGEPGGRLCADLRQDHADVRSWQICG